MKQNDEIATQNLIPFPEIVSPLATRRGQNDGFTQPFDVRHSALPWQIFTQNRYCFFFRRPRPPCRCPSRSCRVCRQCRRSITAFSPAAATAAASPSSPPRPPRPPPTSSTRAAWRRPSSRLADSGRTASPIRSGITWALGCGKSRHGRCKEMGVAQHSTNRIAHL